MARVGRIGILLLCLGALALVACSSLPEYAAPKGRILEVGAVDFGTADVISYRTLTRADFKGNQPPPEFAPYAERVGAATCAYILTTPDTQVLYRPVVAPDGATQYRAVFRNLRFCAQMDRSCSWWNPKRHGTPEEYVLEHEQIHFALFELEARRLNDAAPEIQARLQATAPSSTAAVRLVQQQLEAHLQTRIDGVLKRNREFDEDTSMGHNPAKQRAWRDLVVSELAASPD